MDLARTFRTVRHLSASQLAFRPVCRGKFVAMERLPGPARSYFTRRGAAIGAFDYAAPALAGAVAHVAQLQRAVHGDVLDGVADGRFTLLNREIDFGGLDKVEWRRELGERNNRLWRMNLSYMGYLVPFVERHGAAALPVVRSLVASMTAQNPWSSPGVFRDVWHPYSVSHRVINLIACLAILARDGVAVDAATRGEIEAEIRLGAAFILGNLERDLQYNHLFKNFVCLAIVAAAEARRTGFAAKALTEVAGSIAQQFLDDGGHAERAPMYHLLSIIDLRILRDSGVLAERSARAVATTLAAAERAVNAVTHADGDVALFNDSWLREAPKAVEMTDAAVARPAAFLKVEHAAMGYARLAEGGDGVILDYGFCGPDANPGHAHADFLALELSVDGDRTLIDPGVPTYSEGEARNVSRSAASHNGPCLVGAEPIEFWSSFRVGRRGYAYRLALPAGFDTAVAGWHDGYAPLGLKLGRAARLYPGRGLLICDRWEGAARLPEQTSFLVSAAWTAMGGGRFSRVAAEDASAQTLTATALTGATGPETTDNYWLRFGLASTGTRLVFRPVADGDARVLVTWFQWGDGAEAPVADGAALAGALATALRGVS